MTALGVVLFIPLGLLIFMAKGCSGPTGPDALTRDLPAVRISYVDLLDALRKVRDASSANPGRPQDPRPTEVLRIGLRGASGTVETSSLDAVERGGPPVLVRDVAYELYVGPFDEVSRVSLEFSSLSRPHMDVYGESPARKVAVAEAAETAFRPYAPMILAHPDATKYGLVGLWFAMQVGWMARVKRRSPAGGGAWNTLVAIGPMLGLILLHLRWGGAMFPSIVAHQASASWWVRHSSETLLGAVAVGVTAVMSLGMWLDVRARVRGAAAEVETVRAFD